jgi:isoaspartyl peptidase/L-asparaginase-like protein (Ntn-hydrolase superfamily)
MGIGIIVHGGAGNIPLELHAGFEAGCRKAAAAGWKVLADGRCALDAVECVSWRMIPSLTLAAAPI